MLDFLLDMLVHKSTHFETSLRGVNGYTGQGGVTFAVWPSGKRKMDIELRGVAGRVAEIYANGSLAAKVDLDEGRAGQSFNSRRGDPVPDLAEGAQIDVRQNGQVILEGVFNAE